MKKLILIILLLFSFSQTSFSQETIKLYVEDSKGQIDSVWFGINDNASAEIDTSLGETNIFGIPFNDLDIRVIQRDSSSFNCLYLNANQSLPKVIFPKNIDSKIDFRNRASPWEYYWNYEIIFKAVNYPVTIKGDFSKLKGTGYDGWSTIFLLDKNCSQVNSKPVLSDSNIVFKIADSSTSTIIVEFSIHSGIKEENTSFNSNFNISPNPFADQLQIESKNLSLNRNLQVKIYNLLGQTERAEKLNSNNSNINLTNLKPGIYFIEIEDNIHKAYRQKIIKY